MTYSAGIVGTGFVAGQHANAYDTVDGIDTIAVCDIDEDSLNTFGSEWSVPADGRYRDHSIMLEETDLDVVSITTPTFLHHRHVIDAAKSVSDPDVIWCEKPIALSVNDAEEMTGVCDETDTELVINHNRRFDDNHQAFRQLVNTDDLLGDIESVSLQFGRELLRNGTHTIDMLIHILDEQVVEANGYLTEEHGMKDTVTAAVDGPYDDVGGGGTIITESDTYVTVDHTSPRDIAINRADFVGTEGRMEMYYSGDWTYWGFEDAEWDHETPHESVKRRYVEKPLPDSLDLSGEAGFGALFINGAEHVVSLLDGDVDNISPAAEATHVLEVLVGLFISHYTGSEISFPLKRPLRDVTINSW